MAALSASTAPATCVGARKEPIIGMPDPAHISTSHVERQNLNIRMGLRRFTRLTNAFSKKIDMHIFALSLYFVFYNFVRTHKAHKLGTWRKRQNGPGAAKLGREALK